MKGISFVICCYNSVDRLPETLRHIAAQKFRGGSNWELIIVNNNSTDGTRAMAEEFATSHPQIKTSVIDEKNPGLSHARHAGFSNAAFEYIVLCDDDNWLDPFYGQTVYDLFEKEPQIGIIGGIGEAVTNGSFPTWFKQFEYAYAVGKLFGNGGYVKYAYGAGMGLRKSVYQQALDRGFTSLLSDRKGKELSSAGDLELCYIFQFMGYRIFQSDKLRFKHFIDQGKLTDDYWKRLNIGFAKTLMALRPYDLVLSKRTESPRMLWMKEYAYIIKDTFANLYKRNQDWQYLLTSIKVMASKQKEFCSNIQSIRKFAAFNQ